MACFRHNCSFKTNWAAGRTVERIHHWHQSLPLGGRCKQLGEKKSRINYYNKEEIELTHLIISLKRLMISRTIACIPTWRKPQLNFGARRAQELFWNATLTELAAPSIPLIINTFLVMLGSVRLTFWVGVTSSYSEWQSWCQGSQTSPKERTPTSPGCQLITIKTSRLNARILRKFPREEPEVSASYYVGKAEVHGRRLRLIYPSPRILPHRRHSTSATIAKF